jgi:heptosyltransferase III
MTRTGQALSDKSASKPPLRILIIRPAALGDTIVTAPVIAALRGAAPDALVRIAGRLDYLPLLVGPCLADACCSTDDAAFTSLYTRGPLALPPTDWVVAYLSDEDGSLQARLAGSVERVAVFDPRPPDDGSVHIVDHLLSALRPLGINAPAGACPALASPNPSHRAGNDAPVVIHPGSGGRAKTWPAAAWAEVMDGLGDVPVVVTAGPADGEIIGALEEHVGQREGCTLLRCPSVMILAQVLSEARAYAGVDSGVSHLAAALGVPSVVIFGPTHPATWAPRGPRVHILRDGESASAVSPDEVLKALAAWMG